MKKLSIALSVIFNPLLIATYLYWTLTLIYPEVFWPYNSKQYFWLWSILAIGTLVMPAISMLFLKITGYVSSFEIPDRRERSIPFFFITFWHFISSYLLITKLSLGWHMAIIMVATTLLIALLTLITFWYKISIHSAGVWGAAGYLTAILVKGHQAEVLLPLSLAFLIAGAVGSARMYLNLHTLKQVIWGGVMGFLVSFLSLYIFW